MNDMGYRKTHLPTHKAKAHGRERWRRIRLRAAKRERETLRKLKRQEPMT